MYVSNCVIFAKYARKISIVTVVILVISSKKPTRVCKVSHCLQNNFFIKMAAKRLIRKDIIRTYLRFMTKLTNLFP